MWASSSINKPRAQPAVPHNLKDERFSAGAARSCSVRRKRPAGWPREKPGGSPRDAHDRASHDRAQDTDVFSSTLNCDVVRLEDRTAAQTKNKHGAALRSHGGGATGWGLAHGFIPVRPIKPSVARVSVPPCDLTSAFRSLFVRTEYRRRRS
jgi:hypothetical protein